MSNEKFDYYTINLHDDEAASVFGWSTYERSSVLAGQPRKVYIESFDTLAEAEAAYPGAGISSRWTEPQISVSHLPGEDDPVPGVMYPDDWTA